MARKGINKYTSIARPLDFNYPSNSFIAIFTIAVFVLGTFFQSVILNQELSTSLIWSFEGALSVFLAWAIGREIDPDNNSTAILASILQVANLLIVTRVNILFLFLILLLTRMLSRTTGLKPGIFDSAGIVILAIMVTYFYNFTASVIAALALLLDAIIPEKNKWHYVSSVILLIIAAIAYSGVDKGEFSDFNFIIIIAVSLVFAISILLMRKIKSKADYVNASLSLVRVQASQFIVLTGGFLAALIYGNAGYSDLSSLWAVMASASLIRIISLFKRKF